MKINNDNISKGKNLESEEIFESELKEFLDIIKNNYLDESYQDNIPKFSGNLNAVCVNNFDPWSEVTEDLEIGKTYEVEYALIGRSWTLIGLKEFPDKLFNSILFNFYDNNKPFDIINDFLEVRENLKANLRPITTLVLYCETSEERFLKLLSMNKGTPIIFRPSPLTLNKLK